MKSFILTIYFLLAGLLMWAQSVPQPAPAQSLPIILSNATVHVGDGTVLENTSVVIEDGKIVEMGTVTRSYKNAQSVDCEGKHIYPGMILIGSSLGLTEIGQVRATVDQAETGSLNANSRAMIAYNTDSRVIPTVRSNGVLMAQVAPSGGLISGTSSVMQLDAWNYEDAVVKGDDAVYLNWPRTSFSSSRFAPPRAVQEKRAKENLKRLYETFEAARAYQQAMEGGESYQTDLNLEALVPVLKKERKLFVRANSEKQIEGAVALANQYDLDMVIFGGAEAHLKVDLLKQYDIPVVLTKVHALPRLEDDPIDMIYRQPAILQEAGILFSITITSNWQGRNLPFQAGSAVAFGMDAEEALMAVTANPAKILGLDEQVGSIAVGKEATLFVCEGDVMDMRTSTVSYALIQGREINLGNKQKDLYEKFKTRY